MIVQAKVSQQGVAKFRAAIADVMILSARIENCTHCINEMRNAIDGHIQQLQESIGQLEKAKAQVEKKIREIEEVLARLTAELDRLQSDLSSVEAEMASTPSSYTNTDDEGNTHEVSNPAYVALCARAASLQSEIAAVESQISAQQIRLDHAQSVQSRIASQIEAVGAVIYSSEEKKEECVKLTYTIEDIKETNARKCSLAHEQLCKIERIIQEYLAVKVKFEQSVAFNGSRDITAEQLVGININIKQVINNNVADAPVTAERRTDDNGKEYRIGDDLIKNNIFQVNGYTYRTDNQGRPISASGKLNINLEGQKNRQKLMKDDIDVIGKGDERSVDDEHGVDDRGHLIGHQFNGSGEMENLVPQNWKINRNDFRKLEDSLATLVKRGCDVRVSVIPFYGGDSRRPDGIFYFYNIDGVSNVVLFPNDITEEAA